MNAELEQKLISKYPVIFKDTSKTEDQSCMAFGCECNDGWYDIIDALCEALTSMYTTGFYVNGETILLKAPEVVAEQIKEKFGSLRFYYRLEFPQEYHELIKKYENTQHEHVVDGWANGYRDYINGIVYFAEVLSSRTCEVSGKKGEYHRTPGGWVKVLNPEVAKTHEAYKARGYKPVGK
jgi:hypothetical protein